MLVERGLERGLREAEAGLVANDMLDVGDAEEDGVVHEIMLAEELHILAEPVGYLLIDLLVDDDARAVGVVFLGGGDVVFAVGRQRTLFVATCVREGGNAHRSGRRCCSTCR